MSATHLQVLLVDDEVLARLAVRQALNAHEGVEIVGECGNATEAMQAIQALRPDLLFLDIQMPGLDGFGLLEHLVGRHAPMVVFTTAFAQHALRAFDEAALDYLLKPFDQARFDQAMARVRRHWRGPQAGPTRQVEAGTEHVQRISVRCGEHLRVIAATEIDWIGAVGNYVQIHVGGIRYLHREPLQHLLGRLDPTRFLRIHRAVAVNLERVTEVHPLFQGNAEVVLRDGTRLGLSRRFRAAAVAALGLG